MLSAAALDALAERWQLLGRVTADELDAAARRVATLCAALAPPEGLVLERASQSLVGPLAGGPPGRRVELAPVAAALRVRSSDGALLAARGLDGLEAEQARAWLAAPAPGDRSPAPPLDERWAEVARWLWNADLLLAALAPSSSPRLDARGELAAALGPAGAARVGLALAPERGEPELFVEGVGAPTTRLAGNGAWVEGSRAGAGGARAVLGARWLCRGKGPG